VPLLCHDAGVCNVIDLGLRGRLLRFELVILADQQAGVGGGFGDSSKFVEALLSIRGKFVFALAHTRQ